MCKQFILLVALLAIHSVIATKYLKERPSFFDTCKLEDKNFNSCFGGNFQHLVREWKDGIPGLKSAGKFDPLHVKRVKLAHDSGGSLSLNTELENVDIYGTSALIVQEAKLDRKPWKQYFKVLLPKLRFDADYKLKGRILTLPLNGAGKSTFETENIQLVVKIDLKLRDEHEFTFTDVTKLQVEIKNVEKFRMHLYNLFNGQKELEDSANAVFNENWKQFFEVLKPAIEQTIEAILDDRFKKIYAYVPSQYLIENFPRAADEVA